MSNVLAEDKKQQVLTLGRLGWSLRRIEEATGVRRETASAYLKAAGVVVRSRGGRQRAWPPKPAIEEVSGDPGTPKPATTGEVSTDPEAAPWPPVPGRAPSVSACEPFREVIAAALKLGRNAVAIWQDLVDDHGFQAGYASVKRFVLKLRGSTPPEARVVITTAPGQEAQVDYGDGPMVRHPSTGKYRRTRLFVLTLGYSRKAVRLLVWRSSAQVWAELHERAFRQLGGSTNLVVLDNLKEGVITPDIYDPALNPLYRDVLAHYGAVALPCRVKDPDRKGKVEAGVGHAKRTPLKGLRFESLEQAQAYLDRWEERWADTRIHGTTKRQVAVMFVEEKPALHDLPLEPFRYYRYGERTVNLDGCVEVEAAYYGAPPGWIGRKVQAQWDGLHVRVVDLKTGQLLREHLRTRRGFHRIKERDRSPRTPQSTTALLRRAHSAGTYIGTLCEQIHRTEGEPGVRRILGVLALAKKHGPAVVEDAAQAALEMGAPNYRFVRRYLERRPPVPLTLRQVDPLIRQLSLYRDLIDRKTGEPI
ncbi:MAG TPA: IS21 family transposase [Methylomirabilota bacterium]|nr:IS21 family transposase [Methylomirabilota bacterium]